MTQLAIFIILTMANVILSTAKSLITVNGDKWSAAFANAVTYGVYTYKRFFVIDTAGSSLEKQKCCQR